MAGNALRLVISISARPIRPISRVVFYQSAVLRTAALLGTVGFSRCPTLLTRESRTDYVSLSSWRKTLKIECMRALLIVTSAALLMQSVPRPTVRSESLWVAFRYDQDRVISYVGRLQDSIPITMNALKSLDLVKTPINRDGSCGYLLPLTEERLHTFVPDLEKIPQIGKELLLLLGSDSEIRVTVEGFVEEWIGAPDITVAVLARIPMADVARFRSAPSSYFLLTSENRPSPPPLVGSDPGLRATTQGVNRFGVLGDLVVIRAENGREVTLLRLNNGTFQRTSIEYSCRG